MDLTAVTAALTDPPSGSMDLSLDLVALTDTPRNFVVGRRDRAWVMAYFAGAQARRAYRDAFPVPA